MSNLVPTLSPEEQHAQTSLPQMKDLVKVTKEAASQARYDARELKQLAKMQAHSAALPGLIAEFFDVETTHRNTREDVNNSILQMAQMYGYIPPLASNVNGGTHQLSEHDRVLKTISVLRRLTMGYSVEGCDYAYLGA